MAYEEASYEIVKENKEYEIRKYSDRLVIETNSIQGNGFRKLFNYISGNNEEKKEIKMTCLLYTSPSPRDLSTSRMPSSA